jgi:hypothetical protein
LENAFKAIAELKKENDLLKLQVSRNEARIKEINFNRGEIMLSIDKVTSSVNESTNKKVQEMRSDIVIMQENIKSLQQIIQNIQES